MTVLAQSSSAETATMLAESSSGKAATTVAVRRIAEEKQVEIEQNSRW